MSDDVIRTPDPRLPPSGSPPENVPDGEITDDPIVAAEHGQTYHPPVDPPVAGMDDDDPRIAAGFGADALDGPAGTPASGSPGDDDMTARVRDRLLADSLGSLYVDDLVIQTAGGVVSLSGIVEDLDIQDHLLGVVESVEGVDEVRDDLRLPEALAGSSGEDERVDA